MKHYFESVETVLEHMGSSKTALTEGSFFAARKIWPQQAGRRQEKDRLWQIFRPTERSNDHSFDCGRHYFRFCRRAGRLNHHTDGRAHKLNTGRSAGRKGRKAIEALQKMSSPYSKVRRNGRVMQIKSEEIVPGDIVLLEAGDAVPADMRIIEASSLKIEEASLTGNQYPSKKMPGNTSIG